MPIFPIGVANSVSANFQFDPLDTIEFARQGNFELLQIYLNAPLLSEEATLQQVMAEITNFKALYFHAEGLLNEDFLNSDYRRQLYTFLKQMDDPRYIIHFDERVNVDKLVNLVDSLNREGVKICVENYFLSEGKADAERNLKKYLALFTLSSNFGNPIYPVLDIPRIFNQKLGFSLEEGLEWCYQILNFFGNRRVPMLLHLSDVSDPAQSRHHYTAVGSGCIPYEQIFHFIRKTRPLMAGAVLEFEDKINPLHSREYIEKVFG